MPFFPNFPPTEVERLSAFIRTELERLAYELNNPVELLRLVETHVAPERPRKGDLRLADGTDWNPGSGQGIYWFDGSTWNKL